MTPNIFSVAGDLLDKAGNYVDKSPLGRCLSSALTGNAEAHGQGLQLVFKCYTEDLIHFTFHVSCPSLHQVSFFLSSQSVDCGSYKLYQCVCLSLSLSAFPFKFVGSIIFTFVAVFLLHFFYHFWSRSPRIP